MSLQNPRLPQFPSFRRTRVHPRPSHPCRLVHPPEDCANDCARSVKGVIAAARSPAAALTSRSAPHWHPYARARSPGWIDQGRWSCAWVRTNRRSPLHPPPDAGQRTSKAPGDHITPTPLDRRSTSRGFRLKAHAQSKQRPYSWPRNDPATQISPRSHHAA